MSFSIVTGGCFFDKGITIAIFHSFGSTLSLRELLHIAPQCVNTLSTSMGVFCPDPYTLMFSSANLVSLTLMVNLAGSGS